MRSIVRVNWYHVYYKGSGVYEAIAEDEAEVRRMAADAGEDLEGMEIVLYKENVCDFGGLPKKKRFLRDY